MFIPDTMNNVRRRCSLPGDQRNRRWVVRTAVARPAIGEPHRYLVRNMDTGEFRTVSSRDVTSLY